MPRSRIRELNRVVGRRESPLEEQRRALVVLLQRSLHLGHTRLALRRYFMLQACGHAIPSDLGEACRVLALRYPPKDLAKIRNPAAAWAIMVGGKPNAEGTNATSPCTTWVCTATLEPS